MDLRDEASRKMSSHYRDWADELNSAGVQTARLVRTLQDPHVECSPRRMSSSRSAPLFVASQKASATDIASVLEGSTAAGSSGVASASSSSLRCSDRGLRASISGTTMSKQSDFTQHPSPAARKVPGPPQGLQQRAVLRETRRLLRN